MKRVINKIRRHVLIMLSCLLIPPALITLINRGEPFVDNFHAFARENVAGTVDLSLLSHRMIAFDENHAVISKSGASFAYGNTHLFFQSVAKNVHQRI